MIHTSTTAQLKISTVKFFFLQFRCDGDFLVTHIFINLSQLWNIDRSYINRADNFETYESVLKVLKSVTPEVRPRVYTPVVKNQKWDLESERMRKRGNSNKRSLAVYKWLRSSRTRLRNGMLYNSSNILSPL